MTEPKVRSAEEITEELKEKYPKIEEKPKEIIKITENAKDIRIKIKDKLKEKTELQEKAKEQLLERSQDVDYGRSIHKIDTDLTRLKRKEQTKLKKERNDKIIARYNPKDLKKYGITPTQLLRLTSDNLNNFNSILAFEDQLEFLKVNDPEGLKLYFPNGVYKGRRGLDQTKMNNLMRTYLRSVKK